MDNPFGFQGDQESREDNTIKRMRADFMSWQADNGVPAQSRLSDLTLSMIGERRKATGHADNLHPGSTMKTKAAETVIIMQWALHWIEKHPLKYFRSDMVKAGKNWVLFHAIHHDEMSPSLMNATVPVPVRQRLMSHAVDALRAMQRASAGDVPKMHFVPHYVSRNLHAH
jgi:hypothetical protein